MIDLFADSGRPAEAILGRTITVVLNDVPFELPVLRIAGNRRWKASLDAATVSLVQGLEAGGDDFEAILAVLASQTDLLLDLLISYDETGVLPSRVDIEESAYDVELLTAVREVWRAANPLVVTGLTGLTTSIPTSPSSPPTSSSRRTTAGRRKKSNGH